MMYRFQAVRMCRPCPLAELEISYGILAEQQDGQEWAAITVAGDVSCDKKFVCALAEQCTEEQLAPLHLADVVEDAKMAKRFMR